MKFVSNGPNEILDAGDFYVSYNSNPGMGMSFFSSDSGGSETALVNRKDAKNKYRILNGDFRKEYLEAAPKGFQACLAVYEKNKKESGSSWSTNMDYST